MPFVLGTRVAALAAVTSVAWAQVPPACEVYTWVGEQANDRLGQAVAAIGYIDQDSTSDFAVASIGGGLNGGGYVNVFSGRTGRLLRTIPGDPVNPPSTIAVGGAGDVDRDGYSDFLVGSPSSSSAVGGTAKLYSGRTWAVIHEWSSAIPGDEFGFTVAGVGDVTQDNVPDIAVSARQRTTGDGYVDVYSGSTKQLIYRLSRQPANPGSAFGFALRGGFDWDRDSYGDIAVSYIGWFNGVSGVRIVSGRTGQTLLEIRPTAPQRIGYFICLFDANTDGNLDIITGGAVGTWAVAYSGTSTSQNPVELWKRNVGSHEYGGSGDSVRDIDGDGVPEVVVAAAIGAPSLVNGYVEVLSGRSGALIHTYHPAPQWSFFGACVASGGSTQTQGVELVVGAYDYTPMGGPQRSGSATAFVLPTTCSPYGEGCRQTAQGQVPSFAVIGPAVTGGLLQLGVSRTDPFSALWLLLDVQRAALDMGRFGLPGCVLLTGAALVVPLGSANANGNSAIALPVPPNASLSGVCLYMQVAAFTGAPVAGLGFTNAAVAMVR